ncbi:MAG: aldose 1-epimerase [Pedobacter sp.]|nr:MAG: aldose 1-epimerase [Pedobacter sp.]
MFSIDAIHEDGFDKIVLTDHSSDTSAVVLPCCGAILHAFTIKHHDALVNVIDHYNSKHEFDNEQESLGFKGAKLSPFVCRLNNGNYHFGESDHHIEKFYLGKNAIHGLIYDAAFVVVEREADIDGARVSMKYEYRKNDAGYPFNFDCTVSYTLEKNNRLTVKTIIVNKDEGLIPMADGWHPYFSFGGPIDELQLEFQSKEIVEFEEMIPTGKLIPYQEFGSLKKIAATTFDDCFTVNFAECQPMLVLRDAAQQLQLELYPERSYPYLQIYTPPHRKSIAFENLSAAPDAFNNGMGLITMQPGEERAFVVVFALKSW